ncbi:hypothetical protein QMK38_00815 [Lysinibacillus fusiformis]|nr:hypothetical protein [Lysinibacillus fusiformis]
MTKLKIALLNESGRVVKTFTTPAEAQNYCVENKICNAGWVARSLETGEKFYYPQGRPSTIYNGYTGAGMSVKRYRVKEKDVQNKS